MASPRLCREAAGTCPGQVSRERGCSPRHHRQQDSLPPAPPCPAPHAPPGSRPGPWARQDRSRLAARERGCQPARDGPRQWAAAGPPAEMLVARPVRHGRPEDSYGVLRTAAAAVGQAEVRTSPRVAPARGYAAGRRRHDHDARGRCRSALAAGARADCMLNLSRWLWSHRSTGYGPIHPRSAGSGPLRVDLSIMALLLMTRMLAVTGSGRDAMGKIRAAAADCWDDSLPNRPVCVIDRMIMTSGPMT